MLVDEVRPVASRTVYNLMTTKGNFFANGFLVDQCDTRETWPLAMANEVASLDALYEHKAAAGAPTPTDVGATPHYVYLTPNQLLTEITSRFRDLPYIMVTGGEPANYDLGPLVRIFHENTDRLLTIETSGTALGHIDADFDWVVVSPKFDMPGGLPVLRSALLAAARPHGELKLPIGKRAHYDIFIERMHQLGLDPADFDIALQPLSQSAKATQTCLELCYAHGHRLSIQIHKYIGVA